MQESLLTIEDQLDQLKHAKAGKMDKLSEIVTLSHDLAQQVVWMSGQIAELKAKRRKLTNTRKD